MATKLPDLRHRLPSVGDLLEMPAVRAVSDRWNRTVVASGIRSFLDELRSDLERRASEIHLPSLRDLAERAARHVARLQSPVVRPAINATGRLLDPSFIGRPLADESLQQLVAIGAGYVSHAGGQRKESATRGSATAKTLCRLTGAEAATTVHSYSGAIWLALAGLAAGKECLVARTELGDVEPSCSIAALAVSADASVREVGAANRSAVSDYESAVNESTAAILKHRSDSYRIVGETQSPDWEELIALARDRELPLIHAAGSVPLAEDVPVVGDLLRSVAADIAAGVQLVIARGDGLVGGPPCGLLIGNRELVARVESHPLFTAWQIDPLRLAGLQATLDAYADRQRLEQSVPLFQLLAAPVDNLRQRADRLAPQLAQADGVQSADAIATENPLGIASCGDSMWPSYAIALSAVEGDAHALDEPLLSAPLPVVGRHEQGRLVLDLRTVLPRQDQRLVEIILGETAAKGATAESCHDGNQTTDSARA